MPSTLYVGLRQRVSDYEKYFLSDKDDLDCDAEDFVKAVAFRVLCSAILEEFVEQRCKEVAVAGIDRLQRGQSTAAGRALVVWWVSRNIPDHIPIHVDDVNDFFGQYTEVLQAYTQTVDNSHGLSAKDFRRLVNPVGLRPFQFPWDSPISSKPWPTDVIRPYTVRPRRPPAGLAQTFYVARSRTSATCSRVSTRRLHVRRWNIP